MTREELQKRLVRINGQSPYNKAIPKNFNRRGKNFVETEPDYEGDALDNFFNFEEDLADMESARRQVEKFEMERIKKKELTVKDNKNNEEQEQSFFTMSEFNEIEERGGSEDAFFILDELDGLDEITGVEIKEDIKNKYDDVIGFKFEYCSFIKKDGSKCKRQSPKNGEYCSTHRKYMDKHKE